MVSYEENYLAKRPQSLCKMCGKCCRMATISQSYEEIKKLEAEGHQGAKDFLSIFEPYESLDQAREVDKETVDKIINLHKLDGKYNENMRFYQCKYIQKDNLCGRYLQRPTLCNHFPSSPWAIVPEGCGFEGWLFWKREEIKQKVRKEKEELLELELLKKKTTNQETLKKIELVEQKLTRNINLYKEYGSQDW